MKYLSTINQHWVDGRFSEQDYVFLVGRITKLERHLELIEQMTEGFVDDESWRGHLLNDIHKVTQQSKITSFPL